MKYSISHNSITYNNMSNINSPKGNPSKANETLSTNTECISSIMKGLKSLQRS